jgi:hypothetical protein
MGNEGNHGKQQQQVDQAAGHVKHDKAAGPQQQKQYRYNQEWSESHLSPPVRECTRHRIYMETGLAVIYSRRCKPADYNR